MIARNFTYRGMKGEIDLVGYDGATVAFIEVKTRTAAHSGFGSPEEAVTHKKQQLTVVMRVRVPRIISDVGYWPPTAEAMRKAAPGI